MQLLTLGLKLYERGSSFLSGLVYAFKAKLTSSIIPDEGTFITYTGDDGDATVSDFEGLIRDTVDQEVRLKGSRRVQNKCRTLMVDSMTAFTGNTIEGGYPDPEGGNAALRITATSGTFYRMYNLSATGVDNKTGSLWVRRVSGTGNINFGVGEASVFGQTVITSIITSTWQRLANVGYDNNGAGYVGLGSITGTIGDVFEIYGAQVEEVLGQTNKNPSEFVSYGVGTEPNTIPDDILQSEDNWALTSCTIDTVAEQLNFNGGGGGSNAVYSANLVEGDLYRVRFDCINVSAVAIIITIGGNADTVVGSGNFTYDNVIRVGSSTDEASVSGIIVTSASFKNFRMEPIKHGSNADGVKYFDTLNYNTVTSNVVSILSAPAGAGVQQIADPTMSTTDVSASGVGEFTWSSYSWNIDSTVAGKLVPVTVGAMVQSVFKPEDNKCYRVQYTISGVDAPLVSFGTVTIPNAVGSHDVLVWVTNPVVGLVLSANVSGIDTQFDDVYITPLSYIPDDYLEGVLIEKENPNGISTPSLSSDLIAGLKLWDYKPLVTDDLAHSISQSASRVASEDVATYGHFVKGTKNFGFIRLLDLVSFDYTTQFFNLETGDVAGILTSAGDVSIKLGTPSILAVGGGYKCSLTFETGTGVNHILIYGIAEADTSETFVGVIGEVIGSVSGIQAENGVGYNTSHIPTGSSTATRTKDVLQYETPTNLTGSIVNDFVITGELTLPPNGNSTYKDSYFLDISTDSNINRIEFKTNITGTKLLFNKKLISGNKDAISDDTLVAGYTYKYACRVSSTQGVHMFLSINGAVAVKQTVSDSNTDNLNMSTGTNMFVGSDHDGSNQANIPNKNFDILEGDLSDDECVELLA